MKKVKRERWYRRFVRHLLVFVFKTHYQVTFYDSAMKRQTILTVRKKRRMGRRVIRRAEMRTDITMKDF